MQRQIVGVVQNVTKALPRIKRDEVGVVELAPAPTQPGLLRYQLQHVGPQGSATGALGGALVQSPENAAGLCVQTAQGWQGKSRHRISHGSNQQDRPAGRGSSRCNRPTPDQVQHQQQEQLHHAGARRRGCIAQSQQNRRQHGCSHAGRQRGAPRSGSALHAESVIPPEQSSQANIGQCCKLITLSQIGKGLTDLGAVDPRCQCRRSPKILQQADGRADQGRRQPGRRSAAIQPDRRRPEQDQRPTSQRQQPGRNDR